jgi:uncharacterized protein YbaP (TraB family)
LTPAQPASAPSLRAAPPADAALAQRIAETGRRGFLYEAVRGSRKVFLYGSTLYGKADYFPLNPALMQALAQSSRLLVEQDMSKPDAANQFALELGTLPPGDSLERHIPADLAARLYPEAARLGLQPGQINRYRPWVVSAMLANAQLTKSGYAASENTTYYLLGYARAQRWSVKELEGNFSQLKLINSQDKASQTDQLSQSVAALESNLAARKARLFIDQGWAQGDEQAIDRFITAEQGPPGPWASFYAQSWLAGRSQGLVAGIEADLALPGSPLVVVSAANLPGPTGVLALLAARGFSVRNLQPVP